MNDIESSIPVDITTDSENSVHSFISIIIVDDEKKIRQGLSNIVNWEALGYRVAGTFENGYDAMLFIQNYRIDVVLTDIKMPKMSGLELMQYIKKNNPETKIIILSGYDEFSYVKEALTCGALDYILKPTDIDELESILTRTKETILREKQQIKVRREAELLRNRELIYYLLKHNTVHTDYVEKFLKDANCMSLSRSAYWTALYLQLDDTKHIGDMYFYEELIDFLDRIPLSLTASISANEIGCLVGSLQEDSSPEQFIKRIMNTAQGVLGHLRAFGSNVGLAIGIGDFCSSLSELYRPVQQSHDACLYSCYRESSKIIHYPKLFGTRTMGSFPDSIGKDITGLLLQGEQQGISDYLNYLFDSLIPIRKPPFERILQGTLEMLIFTFSTLRDMGIDPQDIFNDDRNPMAIVQEYGNIKELHKELQSIFSEITSFIENHTGFSKAERTVYLIREYLKEHCIENISLQDLSEQFSLSSDYISRIYKQVTGENITAAIARYRIDYAKQLIRQYRNKTLIEIASLAGFTDVKYFSKVFKKVENMSPSEYKSSLPI